MFSKVEFEVVSGLYSAFLNWIVENEISVSDIRSTDFGFTAVCNAKDYKKLAGNAKKFQCRTKIIKRKGVYFKLRKTLKRKGLFAGIALVYSGHGCRLPDAGPLLRPLRRVSHQQGYGERRLHEGILGRRQ